MSAHFSFSPSRRAAWLIAAGGAVSASAALIIPIPLPFRLLAAAALAALFYRALQKRALLRDKHAVSGIIFRGGGEVIVLDARGDHHDTGKIIACTASPLLSTAVIAGSRRRYHMLTMPDSLPARDYRHLRIRLRAVSVND